MPSKSIVSTKALEFSIMVINYCKSNLIPQKEFVLSKQLVRCSTSIGANIEEALGSYSKRDFSAKMSIAYKEAREAAYWLKILNKTNYLDEPTYLRFNNHLTEILKMLYRIVQTSRAPKTP